MILTLLTIGVVAAVYLAVSSYVERAKRSFANADRVMTDLTAAVRTFVESDAPPEVARLAIQMSVLTGCGCFMRGVLMSHYLPRGGIVRANVPKALNAAFQQSRGMPIELQTQFDRISGLVMIYDSFRNPIQGWLFRRVLWSFVETKPTWNDQAETKLALFSVLSRKRDFAH